MLNHIVSFILGLGLPGVFLLSTLDSSFLFYLPFAMDALFILLISHHRSLTPYLILLTIAGSLAGCAITYVMLSRSSSRMLEHIAPAKKLKKVKARLKEKGAWAMGIAAALPPPFPFTPFIVAGSAAKMSLKRLLLSVLAGRAVRYVVEAILALMFGRLILRWLKNPVFQWIVLGIFVLALVGSVITIIRWARVRGAK